jgi:sugar lactone lactonase YvrE
MKRKYEMKNLNETFCGNGQYFFTPTNDFVCDYEKLAEVFNSFAWTNSNEKWIVGEFESKKFMVCDDNNHFDPVVFPEKDGQVVSLEDLTKLLIPHIEAGGFELYVETFDKKGLSYYETLKVKANGDSWRATSRSSNKSYIESFSL